MSKKLRHHYVPAGLVRNFCQEGESVYYYDREQKRISYASPSDVFRIKKLHTVIDDNGTEDHNIVENVLMKFEEKGIGIIRKIIEGALPTGEDREWLAQFWAIQLLRTPTTRDGVEGQLLKTLEATAKTLDEMGVFPEPPNILRKRGSSMTELLDKGEVKFEITLPQVTMRMFLQTPEVGNILNQMNWCILKSSDQDFFLLSDNPCSVLNPDFDKEGRQGIGVGWPDAEVTFPVGKKTCLLASWGSVPSLARGDRKIVNQINRRSAFFGERFFVHPLQSKRVLDLILSYEGATPRMDSECVSRGRKHFIVTKSSIRRHKRSQVLYNGFKPIFRAPSDLGFHEIDVKRKLNSVGVSVPWQ